MNSFFASCEQQLNPALRGQPIAVIPMQAENTSVLAASYPAKKFGIKTGTLVKDARTLCPEIKFVVGEHRKYIEYHHQIIAACDKILPIHSVCSIDEICFELTGTQQQPEKAMDLAEKLRQQIYKDVGEALTCSIGIAPNILIAKMAADFIKPNGLSLVKKSELPGRLENLKLRDIPGVGSKMEARLNAQGINSMKQLLALNENQMKGAWKSLIGPRYFYLFRGYSFQIPKSSQKSMSHQHVLPPDARTLPASRMIALKLLNKACQRMRDEGLMCRKLGISIKFYNNLRMETEEKTFETSNTSQLASLIVEYWKSIPKNQKPMKVSIVLSDFIDEKEHQISFFENDKKERVFKTVDEINKKFGKNAVHIGSLKNVLDTAPTRIAFSRIPELEEF
ncbi:MAG: DNA polymerase [Pseudobdellovibrionaceae bacterium]